MKSSSTSSHESSLDSSGLVTFLFCIVRQLRPAAPPRGVSSLRRHARQRCSLVRTGLQVRSPYMLHDTGAMHGRSRADAHVPLLCLCLVCAVCSDATKRSWRSLRRYVLGTHVQRHAHRGVAVAWPSSPARTHVFVIPFFMFVHHSFLVVPPARYDA
jgi:hypothetical protein